METKTEKLLKDHFRKRRINDSVLTAILDRTCESFGLGKLINFSKIPYGYQVVNLKISTDTGKFFVKIFPNYSYNQTKHYVDLMLKVIDSKISYPKLLESTEGYILKANIEKKKFNICVQEHIDGKSFFEMKTDPDLSEVKTIAYQAALINSINYIPKYHQTDTWATRNFIEQYKEKSMVLNLHEKKLIEPILGQFKKINLNSLPKSFTHGDIGHTNVMKDINGKTWIIDFGVAAYQPRIMEMAVLFHDLFLDLENPEMTELKRKTALEEYQKKIKLTVLELQLIPLLVKVTSSMYLMSAAYMMRKMKDRSKEIEYWYNRSRKALERY